MSLRSAFSHGSPGRRASLYAAACTCVAVAVAACNQATPSLEGFSCSSDGDCNEGLKCMPYLGLNSTSDAGLADGSLGDGGHGGQDGNGGDGGPADAGSDASACFSSGNQCLVPCHSNADCRPTLVCFTACGQSACEAPGLMGVPADAGGAGE